MVGLVVVVCLEFVGALVEVPGLVLGAWVGGRDGSGEGFMVVGIVVVVCLEFVGALVEALEGCLVDFAVGTDSALASQMGANFDQPGIAGLCGSTGICFALNRSKSCLCCNPSSCWASG